jgi:hypothetical protein
MRHIKKLSNPVKRANSLSMGNYLILAGQILGIVAGLFDGKSLLNPGPSSDSTE